MQVGLFAEVSVPGTQADPCAVVSDPWSQNDPFVEVTDLWSQGVPVFVRESDL